MGDLFSLEILDLKNKVIESQVCVAHTTCVSVTFLRLIHTRPNYATLRGKRLRLKVPHPAARVLSYHNARWLIQQRANFSTGGRNSLLAGRTGTRLNIGRPQTRWEAGYETSVQMLGHRTSNERSSNMLSVGTIFREARAVLGLL